MIRCNVIVGILTGLLLSCAEYKPRSQPREDIPGGERWRHAPTWASASLQQDWWKVFEDKRLSARIATALSQNADLRVLGTRLERARALSGQARAASWPTITLGTGLLTGREQDRTTAGSSVDLAPWTSSGSVSWEIDLFGRIRALTQSARAAERAAFWDFHAGRLLVATEVAEAHFRVLRLLEERSLVAESIAANQMIVRVLREREQAGLISKTELRRQEAEQERLSRGLLDLERLEGLALLQLETLCGGQQLPHTTHALASVQTPPLPGRRTSAVMATRPDLLAAEARVRSAFQLEESTRLQLLPSLSLGAGARGASNTLVSDFRKWIISAGPRLDIPIYDPNRLASVKVRRAATNEAAALYRRAALQAFQEVESSYLNLTSRRRQLQAAREEVSLLEEARQNTLDTFRQGIVSQVELLESERRSLEGKRQRLALRHALLRDYLSLVRALGGG